MLQACVSVQLVGVIFREHLKAGDGGDFAHGASSGFRASSTAGTSSIACARFRVT
jgi:hypothetical protein